MPLLRFRVVGADVDRMSGSVWSGGMVTRGPDDVLTGTIALVQFQRLPTPHVVRVIGPFPDGASAELWAVEHGYRDYVLAPLVLLHRPIG